MQARRIDCCWIVGLLALCCAALSPARSVAEPLPFEGLLELRVGTLAPSSFEARGTADLSAPNSSPRVEIASGVFAGSAAQLFTQTYVPPFAELQVEFANEAGVFSRPTPGRGFGGVLPLRGVARLCLFSVCSDAPLANLSLPLSAIGRADFATVQGVVGMTVQGAPWTTSAPMPIDSGATPSSAPEPFLLPRGGIGAGAGTLHARLVAPIYIRTTLPAIANITAAGVLELAVGAGCDDGLDNDADGSTDASDPGCASPDDPSERSHTACDDGWDLDRDGRVDYPDDPGCDSPADPDETNTYACGDGVDNDGDGFFDYRSARADPGCGSWIDDSERTPRRACDDGRDDDGDGLADLADPDCSSPNDSSEQPGIECRNGIDDDGDGATDHPADSGCTYDGDATETTACANGRDDDEDGAVDYPADPGCSGPADDEEIRRDPLYQCDNGADDDRDPDRLADRWDPGCTDNLDPGEGRDDDCWDGQDNDDDGFADFPADPGCRSAEDPIEYDADTACDNGRDDDGDGVRDFLQADDLSYFYGDPGCDSPADTSEWSAVACDNGVDDDGDGFADWVGHDRGCSSRTDDSERGSDECDDGVANDLDGLVDYPADPQCTGPRDTTEEIDCNDGEDDDGDGLADFPNDPGCASAEDESERSTAPCDNGVDDDQDRLIDAADPGCSGPLDPSERGTLPCDDEIDQDGDGQAAYRTNSTDLISPNTLLHDFGCSSALDPDETRPDEACDDGLDNDGDELVDFAESHCRYERAFLYGWKYSARSELDPNAACDDGLDNDGDGAIDGLDRGCPFPQARLEDPPCDDGLDNDGDGLVDFDDPLCSEGWPYWEELPACGLGAELLVVMPLARWLRRRRSRAA